ncbi:MAG: class I SAM-dependent methyltransferase [Planctomycetes bacterium]|nr:class I SAM-dependent methyltransferase [Planctomycetota bacterium]
MPASKPIRLYIPVVQRQPLLIEAHLLPLVEPLFLIETHMTFEERLLLLQTALGLPPGFVAAEVGSYLGASSSFLAAAAVLKNGFVHCVDTWQNEAMGLEPLEDTFRRFVENTYHFRHLIAAHRGRASEQAPQVPSGLDLLFIDGDHSYPAVLEDLTHYVPKLKPGGLLAMHDYHTFETVRRAAQEYLASLRPEDRAHIHSLQIFRLPPTTSGAWGSG